MSLTITDLRDSIVSPLEPTVELKSLHCGIKTKFNSRTINN